MRSVRLRVTYSITTTNSAIGYITPKDMIGGHQQENQAEWDRKLEAARQLRNDH
jgi:hypothetical protein